MIPAHAHFVWLGDDLPWLYGWAVRSAALRGGFQRVTFHHDRGVESSAGWGVFAELASVETRRIDVAAVLEAAPGGGRLVDVHRALQQPAARVNVLRAAILAVEGGVYLDADTITVRSLAGPCSDGDAFCGEERIVLPATVVRSRRPGTWAVAATRLLLRDLCRRLPFGPRVFALVERGYPTAVNNAVLGCRAGHPFVLDLLERMVGMGVEHRARRFALGTHLLQEVAADHRSDLRIYPPAAFYPLAPEISEHWFRPGDPWRFVDASTMIVHWYASVRTKDIVAELRSAEVDDPRDDMAILRLIRDLDRAQPA